jgi:lipopolysaccharide/colanic/teichoic acid biosynthesis glycosyltransferase
MNTRYPVTGAVAVASRRADYIPVGVSRAKRLFDVACALLGLALAAPLMPLLAALIRIDSRGPVIYRQLRIGSSQADRTELFWIYKLRSMSSDAEKNGAQWAKANDPRITRVGLFLRKTRLDEIPQLWNVLRGDMSMIGPRPERPGFYQKLEHQIP